MTTEAKIPCRMTTEAKIPPVAPWFAIPRGVKLSRCLSKDGTRPILQHAHLVKLGTGWEMLATDSYVIARLPITIKGQKLTKPKPITAEALRRAEKTGGLIWRRDGWEPCNDRGGGIGIRYLSPEPYEKAAGLLNVFDKNDHDSDATTFTVGLSAEFLTRMAHATGGHYGQVQLTFNTESNLRPIHVEALGGSTDARGLLMPVRVYPS